MKELPYFRFTGSEWSNGDISLESDSVKGFFMDVLVYYWSQNCNISVTKMNKKFPRKTKKITLLIKMGIIKVENDLVSIEFLDQQLADIAQCQPRNVYPSAVGRSSIECLNNTIACS